MKYINGKWVVEVCDSFGNCSIFNPCTNAKEMWSCMTTPVGYHPSGCGCYVHSTTKKEREKHFKEFEAKFRQRHGGALKIEAAPRY